MSIREQEQEEEEQQTLMHYRIMTLNDMGIDGTIQISTSKYSPTSEGYWLPAIEKVVSTQYLVYGLVIKNE